MKKLILLAVIFIIICAVYIAARGDVYYAEHSYYTDITDPDSYHFRIGEEVNAFRLMISGLKVMQRNSLFMHSVRAKRRSLCIGRMMIRIHY